MQGADQCQTTMHMHTLQKCKTFGELDFFFPQTNAPRVFTVQYKVPLNYDFECIIFNKYDSIAQTYLGDL